MARLLLLSPADRARDDRDYWARNHDGAYWATSAVGITVWVLLVLVIVGFCACSVWTPYDCADESGRRRRRQELAKELRDEVELQIIEHEARERRAHGHAEFGAYK
jgi:hypothetical protein